MQGLGGNFVSRIGRLCVVICPCKFTHQPLLMRLPRAQDLKFWGFLSLSGARPISTSVVFLVFASFSELIIYNMSWNRLQEPYREWVKEAEDFDTGSDPTEPFVLRMWSSNACEAPKPKTHISDVVEQTLTDLSLQYRRTVLGQRTLPSRQISCQTYPHSQD